MRPLASLISVHDSSPKSRCSTLPSAADSVVPDVVASGDVPSAAAGITGDTGAGDTTSAGAVTGAVATAAAGRGCMPTGDGTSGRSPPSRLSHAYKATGTATTSNRPSSDRISHGEVSHDRGSAGSVGTTAAGSVGAPSMRASRDSGTSPNRRA